MALCEDLPRIECDASVPGSSCMKSKEPRDRSASVRARLLNLARERGEDFQITLRNYLFERFLTGSAVRSCVSGSCSRGQGC